MILFKIITLCVGLTFAVTGCTTPAPQKSEPVHFRAPKVSDLEQVWQGATMAIPVRGSTGSLVTPYAGHAGLFSLTGAGPNTRWPIVLVLMGCGQSTPINLMKALAEQGYIALAPDSQRRFFDPLDCSSDITRSNGLEKLVRARQTEISYARRKLQNLSWADSDNLFLLGLYDGAGAVALYPGSGFKARILGEWGCQGVESLRGIAREDLSPIFAATSSAVPTFAGDCGQYISQGGESQVLVLPSKYSSNILLEPIVYTQMLQFLDRQLFK